MTRSAMPGFDALSTAFVSALSLAAIEWPAAVAAELTFVLRDRERPRAAEHAAHPRQANDVVKLNGAPTRP